MNKLEKEQKILQLYQDGYGTTYIANILGVKYPSIRKYLQRRNIKIRSKAEAATLSCDRRKKYLFDKQFLTTPSWQLSYFAGFCLADGSLDINNNTARLTISIHQNDIEILQQFCQWLHYPLQGIKPSTNNKVSLRISDPILTNCLQQYGIVPNKTYYPNTLNIPNQYIKPFIIGFIDGDGTLKYNAKTGYRFGIVGNKSTIDNINALIKQIGYNKDFVVADNPEDKVWKRLCLYKKQDICDLISLLEPNKYFYLKRKWQSYLDFLSAASI
jgi:hypothetical protein